MYCGAEGGEKLGVCKICGQRVCEKCGNYQHSMGERFAAHNTCIRRDDSAFTMIRFVK
jgi:hypothetical protein